MELSILLYGIGGLLLLFLSYKYALSKGYQKGSSERHLFFCKTYGGGWEQEFQELRGIRGDLLADREARKLLGHFLYDFSQDIRDHNLPSYQLSEPQYEILYLLSLILRTNNNPNDKLNEIHQLYEKLEKIGINNSINPYVAWYQLLQPNWKELLMSSDCHSEFLLIKQTHIVS
jgi:hypothetical protein